MAPATPTKSASASATNSPSRAPLSSLPSSLNSLSLNSPSRNAPSLRDLIYKSGAPKKPITSSAALAAAAAAASASAAGTTKKKSASPRKRSASPNKSARRIADDPLAAYGALDSSIQSGLRASPVKGGRSLAAGGGLGRMDMVTADFDGKAADGRKSPTRRSPSKKGKHYDRYIPSRSTSASAQDHTGPIIVPSNQDNTSTSIVDADPNHTSELSATLGLDPSKRILSFFAEPPPAQGEHSSLLTSYARRPAKTPGASTSQAASQRRRIATSAERVLDAPGLLDDYYLNLLDWSCTNQVAIGLSESVYVWNADSGEVNLLCSVGGGEDGQPEGDDYICSVKFTEDGSYLAVGLSSGPIQVYDVATGSRIRTMAGHQSRVPTLSWSGAILSSGCKTGEIWNSDVRVAQHRVAELKGHRGEVCGLEWRAEIAGGLSGGGQGLLASGGNDNVVNVWDGRMTNAAKMTKTNHTAAVKALAWCPWDSKLLASGGGSSDRTIHFWNTQTSARLNSLPTPSQVTSLVFNPHAKEILSSHGIPDHELSIWSYPSLTKVTDIPQAHETRILHSCLSPDGTVVATASSDENLKFWRVFEGKKDRSGGGGSRTMGEKDVDSAAGLQKKGRTGIRVR
ncbi:WD repeat protein, cell division cycle 20, cofactor of APC complex [Pseudohyphozyma bogoriensis]|nr:WD repeat protein, cell division cycle 20, cofactor of APC complex [Pseudohyphozyma bogoriensis]